jgi:hypothetical protein
LEILASFSAERRSVFQKKKQKQKKTKKFKNAAQHDSFDPLVSLQ